MFGRLSGKRHFRAHSCHSLGTWILPQRVQWWGAGRGRYAFYLRMASCERTWCETKTGCSDIQLLTRSYNFSFSPQSHTLWLSFFPIALRKLLKLFCFFSSFFSPSFSTLPFISSSFLFSKAPSHSVTGLNLNKQSSLCGESFLKECCFPSSVSPWLLGIYWESHFTQRWIWTLLSERLQRVHQCAFYNPAFTRLNSIFD